jgi:hypothetical protein
MCWPGCHKLSTIVHGDSDVQSWLTILFERSYHTAQAETSKGKLADQQEAMNDSEECESREPVDEGAPKITFS